MINMPIYKYNNASLLFSIFVQLVDNIKGKQDVNGN